MEKAIEIMGEFVPKKFEVSPVYTQQSSSSSAAAPKQEQTVDAQKPRDPTDQPSGGPEQDDVSYKKWKPGYRIKAEQQVPGVTAKAAPQPKTAKSEYEHQDTTVPRLR